MKFLSPLFATGLVTLISASALAEGSILKDDAVAKICAESARACAVVNHLNLADVGMAVRMPSGERILPFEFDGSLNGLAVTVVIQPSESGDLEVVLK